MKRYVSRPREVDAVQFTGNNIAELKKFGGHAVTDAKNGYLWIELSHGGALLRPGFWLVRGEKGLSVLSDANFQNVYEEPPRLTT